MKLSPQEVMAIECVLKPSLWEGVRPLMLDLGDILVRAKPDTKEVEFPLSDDELWGILENTPCYPAGFDENWLSIKRKAYRQLLDHDMQEQLNVSFAAREDADYNADRIEIVRRELRHASKDIDPNKDSNDSSKPDGKS